MPVGRALVSRTQVSFRQRPYWHESALRFAILGAVVALLIAQAC